MESSQHTKYPVLSKTRFLQISQMVKNRIENEDIATEIIQNICTIMKFDPEMKAGQGLYDERRYQQIKEYREKKKAEGVSTYVSSGRKKHYHTQKGLSD